MWDLWWIKWHCSRFSPNTSVSLAKHSTDRFIFIIIQGWYSRPVAASIIEDWVPLHPKKGGKK
jgi:hypothetical protein